MNQLLRFVLVFILDRDKKTLKSTLEKMIRDAFK